MSDAARNVVLRIWGSLTANVELAPIFNFQELKSRAAREMLHRPLLKLTSAWWVIQEKACVIVWWREDDLLFPMESRNYLAPTRYIESPEGWDGRLWLESKKFETVSGPALFSVGLEFDI